MALSMTGCGDAVVSDGASTCRVEVRCVNNRFLKFSLRSREGFAALEAQIEAAVRRRVRRGAVQMTLDVTGALAPAARSLDASQLEAYLGQLETFCSRHDLALPKSVDALLSLPGILADPLPENRDPITRVVLCSGKVYYDLKAEQEKRGTNDTTILRVEQLYPLHTEKIKRIANSCPNLKRIVWCQEEPRNMGAWSYMAMKLREIFGCNIHYAGRPESPSPAVGALAIHRLQQAELVSRAFEV
jgi:uncharacterized protein YicC (UPF0701 family)